jgi:anthranilate phosphoribosyltransferase
MLRDVAPLIRKLSEGKDLTAEETQRVLDVCTQEDEEGHYLTAFYMGLRAKGETSEELLGLLKSTDRFAPEIQTSIDPSNLIDVSGTGSDALKTFNVSTAVAFVVGASGVAVAKHGFSAISGFTGSSDVIEAFGGNMIKMCSVPQNLARILEQIGVVTYFTPFLTKKFKYRATWPRKMAEIGLNFILPWNLVGNMLARFPLERRLYGVFSEEYMEILAELFQKRGYKKGLVVYGLDGLDEVSNVGPTKVIEFTKDSMREYTIVPEDLGLRKANPSEIRAISKEGNIVDFLRVLYGVEGGAKKDLVLANAGAALCVMDKAPSLKRGVTLAGSLIDDGKASQKLEDFVNVVGDPEKLAQWKQKAGV